MIDVELRVIDSTEVADRLARRLLRDMADTSGVVEAKLVRQAARAGEREIVDDIGRLALKLATGGSVEAVLGLVKSVLSRADDREVIVKLPDGTEFALKGGGVSEAQFGRATDALLALLARGGDGEKA